MPLNNFAKKNCHFVEDRQIIFKNQIAKKLRILHPFMAINTCLYDTKNYEHEFDA